MSWRPIVQNLYWVVVVSEGGPIWQRTWLETPVRLIEFVKLLRLRYPVDSGIHLLISTLQVWRVVV